MRDLNAHDVFARHYGWTPDAIGKLDAGTASRLFQTIREAEAVENLRRTWLAHVPLMATGVIKPVSFEDYKARNMTRLDRRSNEDILAEVEAVRKELEGK